LADASGFCPFALRADANINKTIEAIVLETQMIVLRLMNNFTATSIHRLVTGGATARENALPRGTFASVFSPGRKLFSVDAYRPMHSSADSHHSSRNSEAKLLGIELSNLHVSKEICAKPKCDQFEIPRIGIPRL
jgi:hypothetical protein